MRTLQPILVMIGATVLLCALVSSASARNFETTSQTLRAQFRELRFSFPFGSPACQVTVEGSFHARTIQKVVGTLSGFITRADLGICSGGTVTILRETLPWHIRYSAFTGTLPNITSVRASVIGASLRVRETSGMIICLARTTATEPGIVTFNREVGGAVTNVELGGRIRVGAECFGESGTFSSDRAPLTALNTTTRITIRLI